MKNNVLVSAAISVLIVGCATGPAVEGDQRADADDATVQTGSRLPESGDRENPRDVDVIDRDDIERSGATSVEEAIRRSGKNR